MPERIHIIGRKNSGKTTLVCELVSEISGRGLKVGTIKHTHHHHQLDTPGKDSYLHREAGSAVVGILAPSMNAVFWPTGKDEDKDPRYDRLLSFYDDCALVLVEGDSETASLKIEVWRAACAEPPLATTLAGVHCVVSDDKVPCDILVRPRSGVAELATWLLSGPTTTIGTARSRSPLG